MGLPNHRTKIKMKKKQKRERRSRAASSKGLLVVSSCKNIWRGKQVNTTAPISNDMRAFSHSHQLMQKFLFIIE